jgi:catechol 2,3-dioxygenase-like lactoylglutathione lyase family enzyme
MADREMRTMPRISITSTYVDDQDKALRFYTDVLSFVKKTEIPLGGARWLTVASPDDPDGTEFEAKVSSTPAGNTARSGRVERPAPTSALHESQIARPVKYTLCKPRRVLGAQHPSGVDGRAV